MLRVTKHAMSKLGPISARVSLRSMSSTGGSGGKTKFIVGAAGTSVIALGGVVAYAKYDPKFRSWVNEQVPYSKTALDYFLDKQLDSLPPASRLPEKPLPRLDFQKPVKELEHKESQRPALLSKSPPPAIEANVQPAVAGRSTEPALQRMMKKDDVSLQQRLSMQEVEEAAENEALGHIMKEMLDSLQEVGNAAILINHAAVTALKNYIEKLEESLDFSIKRDEDSILSGLQAVQSAKNEALKKAQAKSNETKELIEKIRSVVKRGRKSKVTMANPTLLASEEAISNTMYKLQSLEAMVESCKSDTKIVAEYRDMVLKAKREFQTEVKKLLPEVKIGEKGRTLTQDEMDHLVKHAHKRVEQLQKQLAMHQASEKHRFQQALERQKQEHERDLDNRIELEVNRQHREKDLQLQEKISELRDDFEQEVRVQLRRQAAAHSDHLKDMLQIQQTELDKDFQKELEDKLGAARNEFEANLSRSYARLHGIEEGIKARAELNKTAKTSQTLWLACQSLRHAIKTGVPGAKTWDKQLKPLSVEVQAVIDASGGTQTDLAAILKALPETALTRGIYPESTLKERFLRVYRVCRRVALVDEKGGSLVRYGLSYLQSMLLIDSPTQLSAIDLTHQPIDPKNMTAYDVLSRARWCVERDDLELALRYMNLLRGAPRYVASDWMEEVRLLLEVRQAADMLTALSAARGIQSIM